MDDRLTQEIAVTEPGDRLGAVLERLSKKTGVNLYANGRLVDVPVVCRYTGTLDGFMDALTHFFAVDYEHKARWVHTETDRYWLLRGEQADDRFDALRRERQHELNRHMEQAVAIGNPWLKHFRTLPAIERLHVYGGGSVTKTAEELGGRAALDDLFGLNNDQWGQDVTVTFEMAHGGRAFQWRIREVNGEAGQQATEGVRLEQLCPELAPAAQQGRWRARYGDPAPTSAAPVRYFASDEARAGLKPRGECLLQIAERAGVNLIADASAQPLDLEQFPSDSRGVSHLLDLACTVSYAPSEGGLDAGCFWRLAGDVYLVRSLAWPEEEA